MDLLQAEQVKFELRKKNDPRPMLSLQSTQLVDVIMKEVGRSMILIVALCYVLSVRLKYCTYLQP